MSHNTPIIRTMKGTLTPASDAFIAASHPDYVQESDAVNDLLSRKKNVVNNLPKFIEEGFEIAQVPIATITPKLVRNHLRIAKEVILFATQTFILLTYSE